MTVSSVAGKPQTSVRADSQSASKIFIRWRRRLKWASKCLAGRSDGIEHFRCNVCGKATSFPGAELSRELWSCCHCGSNVRWRSVVHALSSELFGASLALPDFPVRPDLRGIGLSDWDGYADQLARKFSYTNTFYHQEPLLDITSVDISEYGRYDFIVASDVFEHISQPIEKAFENAYRMLKPNGVMILTVPYVEGQTIEHFPELNHYSLEEKEGQWVVLNKTIDGREQEFKNITFHGGPGTVIEMRRFGKDTLRQNIREAGFESVHLYESESHAEGIRWIPYIAEQAPYRPLIYGLDTPPWALRKRPSSVTAIGGHES